MGYCGDIDGAIFLHSTSKGGAYADMDVDCDGANNSEGGCSNDPSGQGVTAFQDEVKHFGIKDLDATFTPMLSLEMRNINLRLCLISTGWSISV
jgi:Fungal chitosanase.